MEIVFVLVFGLASSLAVIVWATRLRRSRDREELVAELEGDIAKGNVEGVRALLLCRGDGLPPEVHAGAFNWLEGRDAKQAADEGAVELRLRALEPCAAGAPGEPHAWGEGGSCSRCQTPRFSAPRRLPKPRATPAPGDGRPTAAALVDELRGVTPEPPRPAHRPIEPR